MNRTNKLTLLLPCILPALFFTACKKNLESGWNSRFLAPIATGVLTISDLVPDSLTQVNADNSITLVYENQLLDYNLAEESIDIPDTSVTYTVKLDSLQLDDKTLTEDISLGQIASSLGLIGLYIIANNGNSIPLDPITGFSTSDEPIDATSFFEVATFLDGNLTISIKNGMPIDLTNVIFDIKNASDGAIVVKDTFDIIHAGETVSQTKSLAGLTVEGNLLAKLENFDSPGSVDPVLIDTSDKLSITMTASQMQLYSADAIFPDQNLVDINNNVVYDLQGPELTEMTIKSGDIVIYVVNTIKDSIHIDYQIPGAVSPSGDFVHLVTVVPPATDAGPEIESENFPVDNYTIDLRGSDGISYNTFHNIFTAAINYSGVPTFISLEDSLRVIYGLQDIVPLAAKGYLGQYDISVADTTSGLGIFDQFQSGTIQFGDMDVDLEIQNGIGAEGTMTINTIEARNSKTGQAVYLSAPGILGVPVHVNRALNNPFYPGITTLALNTANSNINALLNILPDQLIYDVGMQVNPDGNTYNYQDFINADSRIRLNLDVSMPLAFFARDLTLENDFSMHIDSSGASSGLQSVDLTLYAENSFPLDAQLTITFLDAYGNALDSINFNGSSIQAAALNTTDCRVHDARQTILHQIVSGNLKDALFAADRARARVVFNTESVPPCSDIVKIYSDYKLSFTLTGDINYTFSTGDF